MLSDMQREILKEILPNKEIQILVNCYLNFTKDDRSFNQFMESVSLDYESEYYEHVEDCELSESDIMTSKEWINHSVYSTIQEIAELIDSASYDISKKFIK